MPGTRSRSWVFLPEKRNIELSCETVVRYLQHREERRRSLVEWQWRRKARQCLSPSLLRSLADSIAPSLPSSRCRHVLTYAPSGEKAQSVTAAVWNLRGAQRNGGVSVLRYIDILRLPAAAGHGMAVKMQRQAKEMQRKRRRQAKEQQRRTPIPLT